MERHGPRPATLLCKRHLDPRFVEFFMKNKKDTLPPLVSLNIWGETQFFFIFFFLYYHQI